MNEAARWHRRSIACGTQMAAQCRWLLCRWLLCGWILCGWTLCAPAWSVPPDMSDQALQTMCQRGLADSAVEYCRAQYNLNIEQAPARSRWAVRLMECQSQAALRATGGDPNLKWQQVEKFESDYRREFADDIRLPWLSWQVARAELLRSQQALARWLATPANNSQQEQALQAVRRVHSLLDALEKDLKERLPLAQNRNGKPTQATSRELHELQLDCALLRCESLLVRAKCYPNQSPDHLAALSDIDTVATEVFRQAAPDWPSRDELRVAQATAGLEIGQRKTSTELLIKTLLGQSTEPAADPNVVGAPSSPPSELARLRAGSALVEMLCAEGKPDQAAEFAKVLSANFSGPEVEMAQLRIAIARMKLQPPSERPQALSTIVASTQAIGQRYGDYWRNRSEALLVAEASNGPGNVTNSSGNSLGDKPSRTAAKTDSDQPASNEPKATNPAAAGMNELLTIEVRQLLAGGQTTAAIARLRGAIVAAEAAGRFDEALQLAVETARLMQKVKQWSDAADLLAPLASAHHQAKDAAAAHALAAWCVAQSLKESASQAVETRYETLLRAQLATWPDADETIKCEEYLAAWLSSKKRFEDLAGMWLDRAATMTNPQRQRLALDRWLNGLLARVPKAKVAAQIERCSQLITDKKLAGCERAGKIAVLAATMLTVPVTQREAEQITGHTMPGHELQQPAGDEAMLWALILLDAVYRFDADDARTTSEGLELAQLSSTVHLAWCKAVALAADELPDTQISQWTTALGRVQLPADASALATPALKMTSVRLQQLRATTPAESSAALSKVRQIAQENANDPQLQLTLAAAIAQSNEAATRAERFTEATKILKRVALGTKKDSEAHLRARWLEARWLLGRGDRAAASQVAQLTLSSTTALQPPWWKARFEELTRSR